MYDITPVLDRYPANCRPTQIEPPGNAGGMSGAQFWRIASPRGKLILRRWPPEHPTPDGLRFIHAVLGHAAERGIAFVPVPIRTTTGESFLLHAGHLWELAPWMPGTADYERAPSAGKLRGALTALAQLHIALSDFQTAAMEPVAGAPRAIVRRLSMLEEFQTDAADNLANSISDNVWPELAPLARQFLAVLPVALPRAISQLVPLAGLSFRLQPCIRDIWHDHVLFTGDEVTGIIDFGAVDVDTPATDVARLLGSLAADNASEWRIGLDAYSKVRPLSADELRAITALDTSGTVLAGVNWLRWIYVERRQFENPARIIERFRKLVARTSQPRSGGSA